jgi:transglutaminase-like putative cysteine protease
MDDPHFLYHGYAELWLGGRWLKVTPTFNRSMCERFGVKTLEFDGESDALLQEFDHAGGKHMEYIHDHGPYDDVPFEELMGAFRASYSRVLKHSGDFAAGK